jgi:hypothetical protein
MMIVLRLWLGLATAPQNFECGFGVALLRKCEIMLVYNRDARRCDDVGCDCDAIAMLVETLAGMEFGTIDANFEYGEVERWSMIPPSKM